ncbi:hypothetical protein [Rhizobium sp. R86522]|uniref:hypothetical protein n=1 Tax=Rhizobium sp. R86522 TaxID=3093861 RepID=UPI00366F0EA4
MLDRLRTNGCVLRGAVAGWLLSIDVRFHTFALKGVSMKRAFLSMVLLSSTHSVSLASSCPLPAMIDFCVTGAADIERLRELAERPGWTKDANTDRVDRPIPRSGSFTATSPDGFAFAVFYQDYGSFASVTCTFEVMSSIGALGGTTACGAQEAETFETDLKTAVTGEISKQTSDFGNGFMIRGESMWMRAVVSADGGITSAWTDSHALKR